MVSLVDLIFRLKASCVNSELDIMAESGLSPAEFNGIAAMEPNQTICGTAVSQKMNLSPSRASRVIDKMVHNGYLKREIDASDRRKCNISLADKGVAVKNKIHHLQLQCERQLRDNLTVQEIAAFAGALNKIIKILG
jgi:MarR family transcriptional regulator, organic hydroperoxide resistance regulator